jgi:hypothetical protein
METGPGGHSLWARPVAESSQNQLKNDLRGDFPWFTVHFHVIAHLTEEAQ